MIKKSSINRILKASLFLIILFIFYIFPSKQVYKLDNVISKSNYHDIFLLDKNNYIAKTTILVKSIEKEKLTKDLLTSLTIDSINKNRLPQGFSALIPKNTIINNIKINNDLIEVSFSNNIMNTKNKEKMIESIVYTLTSIDNIKYVKLYIDNKENNFFDKEYTRNIGINKKYELTSTNNIKDITIYYISSNNKYYIPVTKYINSKEDKIRIIIDELSSKSSYENNLRSYLNYNTKLTSYKIDNDDINLYFNDAILNSKEDNKILEEVIYSISYSIKDNINVSNIHFYVNNKEI